MGIGLLKEIDNNPQSQTSPLLRYFMQSFDKEDITLTSDADIDDTIINVSSGHGISAGDSLIIYNADYYTQELVTNVSSDAITLEAPLALPFLASNTTIIRGSCELNEDGSITPREYRFKIFGANMSPLDISLALFVMSHSGVPDDGKFGDIAALTTGILIRKENTRIFNLGVYKKNQDFRYIGADIEYTQKAPAGIYGTNIKIELDRLGSFGQVVRMSHHEDDILLIRNPEDLSSLASFRVALIGSYTKGEI